MNRLVRRCAVSLLALGSGAAVAAPAAPPPAPSVTPPADFVFKGTVHKLGAATPSLPAAAGTAVVRVDEVIDAPPDSGDLAGQEVTVRLGKASAAREGAQLVFHVRPYVAGLSLGFTAVGETAPGDAAALRQQIAAARQAQVDERLAATLAAAPLVIAGTVESLAPERAREPEDEHDPLWREATIHVDAVGKGRAGNAVVVYFAGSVDAAWARAPRLAVGQKGVFILRDGAALARHAIKGPVVVTPEDVQPRDAVERIRGLLRRGGR